MKPWIVVTAMTGCLLALPAARLGAAEGNKILLAHGAISANVAPLWIAKEQGMFRKHGLDVDLVFIIAGRATQAMLAGQVPVGLVGATHVTNAVTGGGDLVMIVGLQNSLDYLFIARSGIKSGEDLKNKKVAIGTPAGSASLATYVRWISWGSIRAATISCFWVSAECRSAWALCARGAWRLPACRPNLRRS